MGRNLEDPNFKEMSDDELINIKFTVYHEAENYKKASYELDRRSKLEYKKRDIIQRSIKTMTFWILIFTIILILIGVFQIWLEFKHSPNVVESNPINSEISE